MHAIGLMPNSRARAPLMRSRSAAPSLMPELGRQARPKSDRSGYRWPYQRLGSPHLTDAHRRDRIAASVLGSAV